MLAAIKRLNKRTTNIGKPMDFLGTENMKNFNQL